TLGVAPRENSSVPGYFWKSARYINNERFLRICWVLLLVLHWAVLACRNRNYFEGATTMSSAGLNKWIVSGNLAADAQIKVVELRNGEQAQVANATLYVRGVRDRESSFTVSLSIWQKSFAWRALPYLKKGSLIICTGSIEPSPYLSNSDGQPRAGLKMTVLDIDLDRVRNEESETEVEAEKVPVVA
ncbi:MAG: single-stranded DNA-binding protein, partial [Almyronema sp.]